jgi:FAD:protein FMN transferase
VAFALAERRFRAMNTDVAAWLWAEPGPAEVWLPEIEIFFGEVEAELSRFRPDSGLSRLNAEAGRGPQTVSPMLVTVLQMALDERERTQGIFDPTVLPSLRAAGYDRSFELLGSRKEEVGAQGGGDTPQELPGRSAALGPVVADRLHATVELPEGVQIDLGGIAKGWAVDRAAELLGAWGAGLVDAGGDIRATAAPGGEPWPVAVDDPFNPEQDLAVAHLANGAIATSSVAKRNWLLNGQKMHHLIDPRTGRPSESDLVSVTVLAPTTVSAEINAKVALILGRDEGREFVSRAGLEALLVDRDGRVETVGREDSWLLLRKMQATI